MQWLSLIFWGFFVWSCCRAVGAQQIPRGCSVLLIIEQRRIAPGGCCAGDLRAVLVTFHRAFCPWELLLQRIPGHGQWAVSIFYGLLQVVFQDMRYQPSNARQECEARCLFPPRFTVGGVGSFHMNLFLLNQQSEREYFKNKSDTGCSLLKAMTSDMWALVQHPSGWGGWRCMDCPSVGRSGYSGISWADSWSFDLNLDLLLQQPLWTLDNPCHSPWFERLIFHRLWELLCSVGQSEGLGGRGITRTFHWKLHKWTLH